MSVVAVRGLLHRVGEVDLVAVDVLVDGLLDQVPHRDLGLRLPGQREAENVQAVERLEADLRGNRLARSLLNGRSPISGRSGNNFLRHVRVAFVFFEIHHAGVSEGRGPSFDN